MQILQIMHTWRSDLPTTQCRNQDQADLTARKRVMHLHYTDPADRTDPSDHADPPTQNYVSANHGKCMFD